jgi:cytochrome P450
MSDPIPLINPDDFDIHEAGFVHNPYPAYDELRQTCPVVHSHRHGGYWLYTRYEDVKSAVLDWRSYTSSVVGVTAIPLITPRSEPQLPIELDPPLHSRYRALVNPVFSGERIVRLRPAVEAIVRRLTGELSRRREVDLVSEFSMPLSMETLAAFTGFPAADAPLWFEWIRRMFDVSDLSGRDAASRELGEYIDRLIAACHEQPGQDFISLLMRSEVDGHRLTDRELHMFCTTVFGAGFETTSDGLSGMFHYLAEHPADADRLRRQPELIPTAVEEFVRYISPIQIFGRNTVRDVEIHGRSIPAGDIIALSFASANHDPAVFAEPETCRLDRSPNRHLGFGAGIHLCLGAPVARLEMQAALEILLPGLPAFQLNNSRPAIWKTRGDRRGLASLPVLFEG